jgi:hypothetical protein
MGRKLNKFGWNRSNQQSLLAVILFMQQCMQEKTYELGRDIEW